MREILSLGWNNVQEAAGPWANSLANGIAGTATEFISDVVLQHSGEALDHFEVNDVRKDLLDENPNKVLRGMKRLAIAQASENPEVIKLWPEVARNALTRCFEVRRFVQGFVIQYGSTTEALLTLTLNSLLKGLQSSSYLDRVGAIRTLASLFSYGTQIAETNVILEALEVGCKDTSPIVRKAHLDCVPVVVARLMNGENEYEVSRALVSLFGAILDAESHVASSAVNSLSVLLPVLDGDIVLQDCLVNELHKMFCPLITSFHTFTPLGKASAIDLLVFYARRNFMRPSENRKENEQDFERLVDLIKGCSESLHDVVLLRAARASILLEMEKEQVASFVPSLVLTLTSPETVELTSKDRTGEEMILGVLCDLAEVVPDVVGIYLREICPSIGDTIGSHRLKAHLLMTVADEDNIALVVEFLTATLRWTTKPDLRLVSFNALYRTVQRLHLAYDYVIEGLVPLIGSGQQHLVDEVSNTLCLILPLKSASLDLNVIRSISRTLFTASSSPHAQRHFMTLLLNSERCLPVECPEAVLLAAVALSKVNDRGLMQEYVRFGLSVLVQFMGRPVAITAVLSEAEIDGVTARLGQVVKYMAFRIWGQTVCETSSPLEDSTEVTEAAAVNDLAMTVLRLISDPQVEERIRPAAVTLDGDSTPVGWESWHTLLTANLSMKVPTRRPLVSEPWATQVKGSEIRAAAVRLRPTMRVTQVSNSEWSRGLGSKVSRLPGSRHLKDVDSFLQEFEKSGSKSDEGKKVSIEKDSSSEDSQSSSVIEVHSLNR